MSWRTMLPLPLLLLNLALASPPETRLDQELHDPAPGFRALSRQTLHRIREGSAPVVNGTETSDYRAVGALVVINDEGYGGVMCSGTLIDGDSVATAAHCAQGLEVDYAGWDAWFTIGTNVFEAAKVDESIAIISFDYHEDYSARTLANDVAVLTLAHRATAAEPVALNEDQVDVNWVETELSYVGFGITTDGGSDAGVKRTVDLPIWSFDDTFLYALDQENGGNLCSGDSGGAGLKKLGEKEYALAAINSFVWAADKDSTPCEGGGTGGVRVDTYLDWIEERADPSATDPDDPDPDTDSSGTHPFVDPTDKGGCASVPFRGLFSSTLLLTVLMLRPLRRRSLS